MLAVVAGVPDGVVLTDNSSVTTTTWMIVVMCVVSFVVSLTVAAGTDRLHRTAQILTAMSLGVLALAALCFSVVTLRNRLLDASAVLDGPIGSPTVSAATIATTLAVVSLIASTLALAHVTQPVPGLTTTVTSVVVAVVVAAVAVGVPQITTGSVEVERTGSQPTAATGDPSTAVAGARAVVWRASTSVDRIVGDRLLVLDGTTLAAHDLRTGSPLWSTDREPLGRTPATRGPRGSSMQADSTSDHDVALVRVGSRLSGLDVRTGRLRWTTASTAQLLGADSGTAVIAVYEGAPVPERAVDDAENARLVAVDSWSGTPRWSVPLNGRDSVTCDVDGIVRDGHAIYTDCDQVPWSVDLTTGAATRIRGATDRVRTVTDAGSAGALLEIRGADPRDETRAVVPVGADRIGRTYPSGTDVISPAAAGRVLTTDRVTETSALTEIASGRQIPVPIDLAGLDSRTQNWTATGDTLAGPASTSGASSRRVLASVDARTGALTTAPSPCGGGRLTSARIVGDHVVAHCEYGGLESPTRREVLVLGPVMR
ncbi:hypothetical protein GCM10009722_13140 [Williamsia deligens]